MDKVVVKYGTDFLVRLEKEMYDLLIILDNRKQIMVITALASGDDKITAILRKKFNLGDFNGSQIKRIVSRGQDWEAKLKYVTDTEKMAQLNELGFEGSHISQILLGAGWEAKLKYVTDTENYIFLQKLNIEGRLADFVRNIFKYSNWEQRADVYKR